MALKLRNTSFKELTSSELAYLSTGVHNTGSDYSDSLDSEEKSAADRFAASYKKLQELNNNEPLLTPNNFNNWRRKYQKKKLFNNEESHMYCDTIDIGTTKIKSADISLIAEKGFQLGIHGLYESENVESDKINTREEPKSFLNDSLEITNSSKSVSEIDLQITTPDLSCTTDMGSKKPVSIYSSSDQLTETHSHVIYDTISPTLSSSAAEETPVRDRVDRHLSLISLKKQNKNLNDSTFLDNRKECMDFKVRTCVILTYTITFSPLEIFIYS